LHGSRNRANRAGYNVVRLIFDNSGKPTGEVEDFMTGFVVSDKAASGRPVRVAVTKDGSLFVSEDGAASHPTYCGTSGQCARPRGSVRPSQGRSWSKGTQRGRKAFSFDVRR
jgi:glucose/arabinose dehydrogenase